MNKTQLVALFLFAFSIVKAQGVSDKIQLADSLYALGNYTQALRLYEALPTSQTQQLKVARAYVLLNNTTKALASYHTLMKTYPNNIIAQYEYGKQAINAGKYTEADRIISTLSEAYPTNVNFLYQKGVVSEKLKKENYVDVYLQVFQVDSTHNNTLYKLAKYYAEKRQFEVAKQYISKGLVANDASKRFVQLDALVSYFSKNFHAAIRANEKLVNINAETQQIREHLAKSYAQTLQFEKAIDQYAILINEYDDQIAQWHYNLGRCYLALRYTEKAQRHIEISIALLDIPLDGHYMTLATVFGKNKDYKQQMETLQKALKENPQNELAQFSLATTADNYFEDKTAAIPYYERYLKAFGDKGQFSALVTSRIKDIKTDTHFNKN